jgi:hypothetical protein
MGCWRCIAAGLRPIIAAVRRRSGRRLMIALPLWLALAATAAGHAGSPTPTPQPLWDAYPLDASSRGSPASHAQGSGGRRSVPKAIHGRAARPDRVTKPGSGLSVVQSLLAAAVGGILALVIDWLLRRARRGRRRRSEAAGIPSPTQLGLPPGQSGGIGRRDRQSTLHEEPSGANGTEVPVRHETDLGPRLQPRVGTCPTCEIIWSSSAGGAVLRAIAAEPQDRPHVIAQSRRFSWPAPGPPPETRVARSAHAELMLRLQGAGWQPCGHGNGWYAERFQLPIGTARPERRMLAW